MVPNDQPSTLWILIPSTLLISAYFVRKWYLARKLRVHGIGKGAPGFQTNVRKIRVTSEIAARLRRGEDVSPEEIAAASAKAEAEESRGAQPESDGVSSPVVPPKVDDEPTNEWLPSTITAPKKRSKGKKR